MNTSFKRPLLVWVILLLIWTIYRYFFHLPEEIDEFLVKPVVWLGFIIYIVRIVEKRSLSTIGWVKEKFFENVYLGWGIGAFFAFEGLFANASKYRGLLFVPMGLSLFDLGKMILLSLVTGLIEETVFRGYIFTRLEQFLKNEMLANIISSLMFALIHMPIAIFILKFEFWSLISYSLILFLLGFANCFLFKKTRSIVAPTMSHTFWNMAVMLFR